MITSRAGAAFPRRTIEKGWYAMEKRKQSPTMRMVANTNSCCELCGSVKGLEVHHIIPIVCGGDDSVDNLICVCRKCHALLTPRSVLTKIGIAKVQYIDEHLKGKARLYKLIESHCERDGCCIDSIFDAIEEW